MANIGYVRVSTSEQKIDSQLDALRPYNCEKIFSEHISATKKERPEFNKLLAYIRSGDTLVISKLDRLDRSLRDLIDIVNDLNKRNINFICIQEHIDTTTPMGEFIFHLFGALAQHEHRRIKERTIAGLAAARVRGKRGGRPSKMSEDKIKKAQKMWDSNVVTITDICETLGVSKVTLYKYIDVSEGKRRVVFEK